MDLIEIINAEVITTNTDSCDYRYIVESLKSEVATKTAKKIIELNIPVAVTPVFAVVISDCSTNTYRTVIEQYIYCQPSVYSKLKTGIHQRCGKKYYAENQQGDILLDETQLILEHTRSLLLSLDYRLTLLLPAFTEKEKETSWDYAGIWVCVDCFEIIQTLDDNWRRD